MTSKSHIKPTLQETSTEEEASSLARSKKPTPKHEFEGHGDYIWRFVFLHDNVHIVSHSWDGTIRKWNCDTGLLVGKPWKGEGGEIHALALSPDGKIIACGRADGSVQRWNTDGEMIKDVWRGQTNVVSLSWSPSGDHIASGSQDGKILIRKADSGKVVVGPMETRQGEVLALAYSPWGDRIVSGGENCTICIWDSKTGNLIAGPQALGCFAVTSLVWSMDNSRIYSASDESARVSKGDFVIFPPDQSHSCEPPAAPQPNNNVLACVGWGGIAQLWDIKSNQKLGQPFHRKDDIRLFCVSFSKDGRYLAYSAEDGRLTLWVVKDMAPELAALMIESLPVLPCSEPATITSTQTTPEQKALWPYHYLNTMDRQCSANDPQDDKGKGKEKVEPPALAAKLDREAKNNIWKWVVEVYAVRGLQTEYQPGDKVKYRPIGGATSKVAETVGEIVDVKGSGEDTQYSIKNDHTGKTTTYYARNVEGKVPESE
ncbi:WD40-repeat-containing domain protein [Suillus paluster]|uniref:WD40-repeat-containing domain protein n=1 Tax=Suillus paluster TaxID=48578 RepID=UPI001B873C2F|nr:WD40-repeat-containing domain protein [Suillus paluster]KAG1743166.1 WD40-repeat-containing domain protein [Suillus paluster]